jgi:hypothetical protein
VDSSRRPVLLLALLLAAAVAPAAAPGPTLARLSDAVGDTIDLVERDSFHLFPNTAGFQHAVVLALPGPDFYAEVALANGDAAGQIYYRIMPSQLERIRFLVDNRDFVAAELKSDSSVAQTLVAFWRSIEERPVRGIAAEPAGGPQSSLAAVENRFNYALHGTTLGSIAGGCIGSHAGITYVRTEQPECCPPYSIFHVDPLVFWGASCGLTALGTGAGYALGAGLDRKQAGRMTQLKEGTKWRTGLAIGALVPGVAMGFAAFWVLGGTRYGVLENLFDRIENDPDDRTTLPMAFTGLCIAVESATIGYRIGREIDRREAEAAEAKRRALGREAQP